MRHLILSLKSFILPILDLRLLKWQQIKNCKNYEFEKNYKTTCTSEPPSNFTNCTQFKIMENINSSMFNFNKTSK